MIDWQIYYPYLFSGKILRPKTFPWLYSLELTTKISG